MVRLALVLVCWAPVVVAQTVYEWTDENGDVHYTNDQTSIPKGVKARPTEGQELSVIHEGRREGPEAPKDAGPRDPGARPPKPSRNLCAEQRARVTDLERQLDQAHAQVERNAAAHRNHCQDQLNANGQGAYAQCLSSGPPRERALEARLAELEQQLTDAKEQLRRVQVGGCTP